MDLAISTLDACDDVDVLFMTANVGSLFEDPSHLLRPWLLVFFKKVEEVQPKFLALHLQEVGGKTYEKSMEYVQEFIKSLCEAPQMLNFELIRIYMDEDFNSAEHFTALGNLYFVHNSLKNVKIWNFATHNWESAEGKNVYSGNIENVPIKEKSKFPQHFFPECKWSRKGFMRTRWGLNNTAFDLVNIHLFHDASNLAACTESPSVYCKTRRRALVHTLERFHLDDKNGLAPLFVFGDFNFRCNTEGVIKELTENLTAHRIHSMKNNCTKVHYRNEDGDNILTIGKKEFNHADHQLKFKEPWLKKFDLELEPLKEFLKEFPIEFPPSYPYEEDPEMPTDFMSTRCPSWCDRILMSVQAKEIIHETESPNIYSLLGEDFCMGDHKPVYLNLRLKSNQGTYSNCTCFLSKKSTSHQIPAETFTPILFNDAQKNGIIINCAAFCPYQSKSYNEILLECKFLDKYLKHTAIDIKSRDMNLNENAENVYETLATASASQIDGNVNKTITTKWSPVSINIIDSDNIHRCVCQQISVQKNADVDSINGNTCPKCLNIIKTEPTEPRYQLVSRRLMFPNNIIVNRIDTHHLSTYFDITEKRLDPYTPESAESHSPCPELSSSTTTTSNSQSPPTDIVTLQQQALPASSVAENVHNCSDNIIKQHRGVVSPVQLKSRLEDLKKKSSINQNCKLKSTKDDGTAGNNDVENVDEMDKYIAYIPNKLQMIVNTLLGDEEVWKEQCQLDVSTESDSLSCIHAKTRYIQLQSLNSDEAVIHTNASSTEYEEKLNSDVATDSEESDVNQMTLDNKLSAILKETTV